MTQITSTITTYTYNGDTRELVIPFDYLRRDFIEVSIQGPKKPKKLLTMDVDYRFTTKTTITVLRQFQPDEGYDKITIRRITSATKRIVNFQDGSILNASELNVSQIQSIHIAEEARDLSSYTLFVDGEGNLDARGRKIINLGEPRESSRDAVSIDFLNKTEDSVLSARDATLRAKEETLEAKQQACDCASAAKISETNSKQSENKSQSYKEEAQVSLDGAKQAQAKAQQYATSAQQSASTASQAEKNAQASDKNASESAKRAEVAALRAECIIIKSIEELRAFEPTEAFRYANVSSYYQDGSTGGGLFYYDSNDLTSEDDGGFVIVTNGKRWKRVINTELHTTMYGIRPNDSEDNTLMLSKMITTAKRLNKVVVFEKGSYVIGSSLTVDVEVRIPKETSFRNLNNSINPSDCSITFKSSNRLDTLRFKGIALKLEGETSSYGLKPMILTNCLIEEGYVEVGSSKIITSYYEITNNTFTKSSRNSYRYSGLSLTNTNNVKITHNTFTKYGTAIRLIPKLSYAVYDIDIMFNEVSCCSRGILSEGTPIYTIIGLNINNNNISIADTYVDTGDKGINLLYSNDCVLKYNSVRSKGEAIHVKESNKITIEGNNLETYSTYPCIRTYGSNSLTIKDNTLLQKATGSYAIFITKTANVNPRDIYVSNNKLMVTTLGVKFDSVTNGYIRDNTFTSIVSTSANSMIYLDSCGEGEVSGNIFRIKGSSTMSGSFKPISSQIDSGYKAPIVNPPVIKENDTSLNNATSYLVTFSVSSVFDILQYKTKDPMKVSAQVAKVGGARLAFNSTSKEGITYNECYNGGIFDSDLPQDNYTANSCLSIDYYNRLTVRDFNSKVNNKVKPFNVGSLASRELCWQMSCFRTPLVVDGNIYNPSITGLYSDNSFKNSISARTCLGQRADGMYVLLVVDGKSDVSGCTMEQAARKLKEHGCVNAFNLDGGGSTTLWYNGSVVNKPSDTGGERAVWGMMYLK